MKRLFILLFILMNSAFTVKAQQIPIFSQYFHNRFIENPSLAGDDGYGSFFLTHRQQWVGIDGGPTTTALTANMPFYDDRAGFGFLLKQDNVNITDRTRFMLSGAYHIFGNYETSSKLSFGLSAGIVNQRINTSKVNAFDPEDAAIFEDKNSVTAAEVSFGMNFTYRYKLQIGVSFPHLLTTNFHFLAVDPAEKKRNLNHFRHFVANARYTFETSDKMHKVEPIFLLRATERTGIPLNYEGGLIYTVQSALFMSALYRFDDALNLGAGWNDPRFMAGYAYELHTGYLSGQTGGSHEIFLAFKFGELPNNPFTRSKGRGWMKKKKKWHPSRPFPIFRKRRRM